MESGELEDGEKGSKNRGLHQPHDGLFAAAFGNPENTAGLLRAELPPALVAAIDWDSLELQPGSYVDEHFRRSHTDLLFAAKVNGRDARIFVLFEHQSTKDPRLPLRLYCYMGQVWMRIEPQYPWPEPLPAILPVVLSQNDIRWEVPTRLMELLDIPEEFEKELLPFIPDFGYKHLQLAEMEYDAIPGTSAGIFTLRAMKAERLGELLTDRVWDEGLMGQISLDAFLMVMRYIADAGIDMEGFLNKVEGIREAGFRREAMTIAQQLRQEGRQEGRQETLKANILEALELRFGNLPEGLREAIDSEGDDIKLRVLLRAAIQCVTLEDFAGNL